MRNLFFVAFLILWSLTFFGCTNAGSKNPADSSSNFNAILADSSSKRSIIVVDDMPPGRETDSTIQDTSFSLFASIGTNNISFDNDKIILINSNGNINGTLSKDETNTYSIIGTDGVHYSLAFPQNLDTLKTSQMKRYYVLPVNINKEVSQLLIPEPQLQQLLKKE